MEKWPLNWHVCICQTGVSAVCVTVCLMYMLLSVVGVQWSESFRLLHIVIIISY